MSLDDREARLIAACHRHYGRSAQWAPAAGGEAVSASVRIETVDEDPGFGQSRALTRRTMAFVRVADVPAPAQGDTVAVGAVTYRIIAAPRLEPHGLEWMCEATAQ